MTYVDTIIEAFEGANELSRKTTIPSTTIRSWQSVGRIPQKHWQVILTAAEKHDVPVTASTFIAGVAA
ncbi:carph-isopro domain-containing protein [Litorimonas sp.]|uniref:carph-isopro domain-containing protein n=1 Tax=Litorimonas sp. TaxID=1892381 RepID=UPI003A8BBA1D